MLSSSFALHALRHFGTTHFLAHFIGFYTDGLASPFSHVATISAKALHTLTATLGPVVAGTVI